MSNCIFDSSRTSTPSISRSSSRSSQAVRTYSVDNSTPPNRNLGLDFDNTSTDLDLDMIPTDLDQSNYPIENTQSDDNSFSEDNSSNEILILTSSLIEEDRTSSQEKDTILPNNQANPIQKKSSKY